MKKYMCWMFATALAAFTTTANATLVDVYAFANSTGGGSGANTGLSFTAGEFFSVIVNPNDLWNAGALPRWSNADGLVGPLFATGTDESGQIAGTQIGANFGLLTIGSLTAPFGTLVGEISGVFFVIGTNFVGAAPASGVLNLWYWDSNFQDNTDFIRANIERITHVPAPSAMLLMLATVFLLRKRGNKS